MSEQPRIPSGLGTLTPALAKQVEAICRRFEAGWQSAEPPRVEQFLTEITATARPTLLRRLLETEWTERLRRGDKPSPDDYRQRFPEYGKLVDGLFRQFASTRPAPPALPADVDPVSYVVVTANAIVTAAPAPEFLRQFQATFAPGCVIQDRYALVRELGRGAMGQVFLGHDERLDRPVAIKVILPIGPLGSGGAFEAHARDLFAEEARLGANLTHAAIATVFDFGFHDGKPFTVFEYIPGETLRELIKRRGRLPLEEVRLIIGPLAQALDSAHARKVVHRDLKPDNIRATEQGQFKILDLGLARDFCKTNDWRFAGTPAYASPEQAAGLPCDGRTDQYALALIAFEMLAGRWLFESRNVHQLLEMHRTHEPTWPLDLLPDLPDAVTAGLKRALQKDPAARFASCEDFATALGCQFLSAPVTQAEILRLTALAGIKGLWRSSRFRWVKGAVYLLLTPDALWGVYRDEMVRWPLTDIQVQNWKGKKLACRYKDAAGEHERVFEFVKTKEREEWDAHIGSLQKHLATTPTSPPPAPVEPVVLIRQRPKVRFQVLGPVEYENEKKARAEVGLQVRAAMMGADAVIDVDEERLAEFRRTRCRVTGTAVRTVDLEGRREVRLRWFGDEVTRLSQGALGLIGFFLVTTVTASVLFTGAQGALAPNLVMGQLPDIARRLAFNLALILLVPLLVVLLLCWLRWPQLARPAAIAVAALGLKPLPTVLGFWTAAAVARKWQSIVQWGGFMVPFNLALMAFGLFVARRLWRAFREYSRLDPRADDDAPRMRKVVGRSMMIASGLYALTLFAYFSWVGYTVGTDLSLDQLHQFAEAVKLTNSGLAQLDSNRANAERVLSEALPIWRDLVANNADHHDCRFNLATTLTNLGALRFRQGRFQEAEDLFQQAQPIVEELIADFHKRDQDEKLLTLIRNNLRQTAAQKN